jgi:hypothetical protein
MPSRQLHDILKHLLETSDVSIPEPYQVNVGYGRSSFHYQHMQQAAEPLTLTRLIREEELHDFPVTLYNDLLEALTSWSSTRHPIDISRRFKGVYISRLDRSLNTRTLGMDIRVEFKVSEYTADDTERWVAPVGVRRSAMMTETHMGLEPNYFREYEGRNIRVDDDFQIYGQKKLKPKKKEDHFDKDLFEV